MCLMLNLVVQEGSQEYRQADISYADAIPVNVISQKSGVILTSGYEYAHKEGQNRAKRIKRCLVWQLVQILALSYISLSETVVADGNTNPGNESSQAAHVDQPVICYTISDKRSEECSQTKGNGCIQPINRNAC